ncbi:MAG: hypothetical protein RL757_2256 [Bacteroidota bacterium]|jgi:outer membrane protein OmpA-like peptidoglycan-associated protein/tetratricopeptide (TPR) repeat protein
MKKKIQTLFFFLMPFLVFSQKAVTMKTAPEKLQAIYKEGIKHNFAGQTQAALKKFTEAVKVEPKFVDGWIQWASTQELLGNLKDGEVGYQQAARLAPDYEPLVWFRLAENQFAQKKYTKASDNYKKYLGYEKTPKTLRDKANKAMLDCDFIPNALANPVPFNPKFLEGGVNTKTAGEYLPSLSADGETLVFTRYQNRNEDLYLSRFDSAKNAWGKAIPLDNINTVEYNEGAQSISPDGRFILLTMCNNPQGLGACDLYYSTRKADGNYTAPKNFGTSVNTKFWESQPSMTADNRTMYFASERTDAKNSDIYVTHLQANGTWSAPESAGDSINTPYEEQTPYIHPDGQTLYFMSHGHGGMGEGDLFVSRIQPNGKWGKPMNLGYPINTKGEEATVTVSLDGKTAYFARASVVGSNNHDLYSFDLYEAARPQPVTYVKAVVVDAQTGENLTANLSFSDLSASKTFLKAQTDENGTFLVCLQIGKNYGLAVTKSGYLFQSENFNLKENNQLNKPFVLKILMRKLPPVVAATEKKPDEKAPDLLTNTGGGAIVLRNVFFETGSAALRPESETELMQLKDLLEKNPTIRIRIQGHTDNVGSASSNLALSQARAKSVNDFLIGKGISSSRLAAKGFGETQPVATNDNPEGRQQNRRTEFVVIE